ncbi:serine hydrolase [Aquiflexum sp.]|uniref:serine hydrolase n=1 Tax=Aquiflexum sp. TaxID=1872584 RepID=UPI003593B77E
MKKLTALLSLMILALPIIAQQNQHLEFKIDSLANIYSGPEAPGFVLGITKGSETILEKSYGMMNLDYQMPITEKTTFNLASVSKHITAIAILKLEEEGRLDLDDPIQKYIPDLPDYGEKISLRNLMHHTSGLGSTDNIRLFAGISLETPWTTEDDIDLIKNYRVLNFTPGDEYLYSNAGYVLLAKIVEEVTGMEFGNYIESQIFSPLGMTNSFAYSKAGKTIPNRASGYKKAGNSIARTNTESESVSGGTNLYMSLEDMLIWGRHFYQPRIISAAIKDRMVTPAVKLADGSDLNYTYGLNLTEIKGVKVVSHSGGTMGFSAYFSWFPEHDLFIGVAANNQNISTATITKVVAESLLADYFEDEKANDVVIALGADQLKKFEGAYSMDDGMVLTFKVKENSLFLLIPDAPEFEMHAESPNKFFLNEIPAKSEFLIGSDGKVDELIWHQSGKEFPGKKVSGQKPLAGPSTEQILGLYTNPDLEVNYNITLQNNEPILVMPKTIKTYLGLENLPLVHLDGDKFKVDKLGIIEFSRDIRKNINGFVIKDVGRLRNIPFEKTN